MLKVARYLHGKFWLVMAWLVILLAIALTVARLTLPHIDLGPYKQEIERIVEVGAGKPLSIGDMQAELRGFRLALKFTDVSLYGQDESVPVSHAREVYVDIELLNSLLNGELRLGRAMVVGTRLQVEQHADGSISLQGIKSDGEADSGTVTEVLLGQPELRLLDSEIFLKGSHPDRPPLRLSSVAVDLLNDGNRHQLSVKAKVGWQDTETLRFIADLKGSEEHPLTMDGRFYLKGENLKAGGRLTEWLPAGYAVNSGELQLELWGRLARGQLQRLHGTSELTDFQMTGPAVETPFQLDRLASEIDWRQEKQGWQVDLDSLVLVRDGQLWPPGRLSLAWQTDDESGRLLRMGADYLSLKELNDFLSIIELPNAELGDALTGLSADGHLTRFGFTLLQPVEGDALWHVGGVVARYKSRPWQSVPGLSGLRLSFEGNQVGGWLRLDSSDFSVNFPKLFRSPINAKRLAGDFTWRFDTKNGLHLSADKLEMINDDVETLSRIELQIPLSGTDLFVDMQSDFWNGDGSRKSDYLPVGIMPDSLVEWLDRSVVSGHVNSGSFLLYGPLNKFPFNQHEGRFEVWFGVEDLVLDYMPGWPRVEQGMAEAHFVNNSFQVSLDDGLLLGNRLHKAQARIRELKGAAPVEIEGEIIGPFADMLKLLSETPLQERFGPFLDEVEVAGEARTHISMSIPLKETDQFKVDGTLKLEDATMAVKLASLKVEGITGELSFDEHQVSAKQIKARMMDQAVTVDVSPRVKKKGRWTRISTRLTVSLEQLRQQYPGWWLPPGQGGADSHVFLEIAHHESKVPVRLKVNSKLRGLAVDLPAPIGKKAANSRKMDLTVDFRRDKNTDLRLFYGKEVHARVRLPGDPRAIQQVAIGFSSEPKLPEAGKGYRISGHLKKLNADPWLAWIADNAEGEGAPTPIDIDLKSDHMTIADIACPDAHFTARNFADGYRIGVESETVKGMVQVPGDWQKLPLLGRFDYIKLDLDKVAATISGTESEAGSGSSIDLDPRDLPSMDLSVDALYVNEQSLGKSHVAWQKERDGITITGITLVGEKFDLSGQGYWRLTDKGHLTSLNLKSRIASLGDLQRDLGMETGIKEAPTDLKAELYWPTSPLDMGAEGLYGSIWLKVGKGQVTDVDPGVGRLIGLFSLNALGKRLALDFRDFFSEGLMFDEIEGNFTVRDGDAETHDLTVKTTSAKIEFAGQTGLVDRTYDQRVVVTPHLSATLPLVGALAVNPTVGVALAVTQKLLGKQFDKIVQRTYEVTGSWDDPQFKQVAKRPVPKEEEKDMGVDLPGRG
ncbi:MAG: TIGR02099 family protein [Candidatus Thiodiazotropha sp. (ex Monitilora ramsayi)]|nr:TIGR02099 family protein [Candidatus Thiodiazotropha sp. (ex Monitilora ramsayi)]